MGSSYEKEWKRVDSLQNKGLSKSALELVKAIYAKAKAEKNTVNFIRAIIEKMKYESYLEEDSYVKAIANLEHEAAEAEFPIKSIIQSIAAETYWRYYQNNRYTFINRSETVNFDNSDIRTWDLRKLIAKVDENYLNSLQASAKLKQSELVNYDAILVKIEGSKKFRPTLYDFLAHRALDYFMNEEPDITKPAFAFELDKANYFEDYISFQDLKVKSVDSTSMKLYAITLMQELIRFHQKDKNPAALIDVDLKRLKFVWQHSTQWEKDSLYLDALKRLQILFENDIASTDVSYQLASYYWDKSNLTSNGSAEDSLKLFKKLALQQCKAIIAKFPLSDAATNATYLKELILEKSLTITLEDANIPDKPMLFLLQYKNVGRTYFKVVKLDETNEFDLDRGLNKEVKSKLLNKREEFKWQIDLPIEQDYCEHKVQLKIPKLGKGHYILFAGTDPSFTEESNGIAHANFWVSSISYITQKKSDDSYEGFVLDRESGQGLNSILIQLWCEKYDYNSRVYQFEKGISVRTDKEGYFNIPSTTTNRNFYLEMKRDDGDRICSDYGFYQYKRQSEENKNYLQTYFFTDRKIYRPGQTVYFKGLMLEKTGEQSKLMTQKMTEVIFNDVNGQKIAMQGYTTNDYGTFNGSFIVPQGLLNGQMSISNGTGSIYFSVEEYKRPKFEVTFNPLSSGYGLSDSVEIKGKAQTYSGVLLDGAKVNYRVVREANFPNWWAYSRGYQKNAPAMEIFSSVVNCDEKGEFAIKFKAIPDLSVEKNSSTYFTYTVYANVTDMDGETHSAEKSVNIGYSMLKLSADFPSSIDKLECPPFKILSSNLNGDYLSTKGVLRIYKLKQPLRNYRARKWEKPDRFIFNRAEFEVDFPTDLYDDEDNKLKWERAEMVAEIDFDTDSIRNNIKSRISFNNMKKWSEGEYVWEAITQDKSKQEIKIFDYFTLFSSGEKKAPRHEINYFNLLVNKGEPGEKARVMLGSNEANVHVLYELENKGEIIKREWMVISDELKVLDIPIEENYRGNFVVHCTFVKGNRVYKNDGLITVPYSNKELSISFETFRNKLYPGQQEEWRIKIINKAGNKETAEMMATLYDASLDAFSKNNWYLNLYQSYYSQRNWEINNSFKVNSVSGYGNNWNVYHAPVFRDYDALNWFGFEGYSYFGYGRGGIALSDDKAASPMAMQAANVLNEAAPSSGKMMKSRDANYKESEAEIAKKYETIGSKSGQKDATQGIQIRKNFNETAFFYPQMETDEKGEISVKFTIPEAVTKWRMLGLAHSKDLKVGTIEKELQTQKDLMISINAPRFLREGDKINLLAKLTNLTELKVDVNTELRLFNSVTMDDITNLILKKGASTKIIKMDALQNTSNSWELNIPNGLEAITYRVTAKSASFSDGEENTLPVLSNKILVTESLPLPVRGNEIKKFTFSKLLNQNNKSTTLSNYKVTLEFTSNPAWYALQALPYLMEYPYECSEQTFARFYANSIAHHIANSNPKIKAVFDSWKLSSVAQNKESLLSNLEKNQELKSLLLKETPWVMQAKNESERKQRLALLFDFNKMQNEQEAAFNKLIKMQSPNGGWPWMKGMPDDVYITQYIVAGMGHLEHLGVEKIRKDNVNLNMIQSALNYMDDRIREDYDWILKHDGARINSNHLSYKVIHYLYTRSYFKDIPINKQHLKAFEYFKQQAAKYWLSQSRNMQGMIALALNRYSNKTIAMDIIKSLKENAIENEELGMYWKENTAGYYWYQAPVETQALLIEAFDEVANDLKSVEEMKVWLLKNKQTTDWKTTKATSEACYALLLRGNEWLSDEPNIEIEVGSKKINNKRNIELGAEAGTGYFSQSWNGNEIETSMGNISIRHLGIPNQTDKVMWGAVYWQYFENLDKITSHATPLQLKKKIFVEKNTNHGPVILAIDSTSELRVGDKVKIRIELIVDRDMEYVQLKDMRASGFEPINVISSYKFQDGLGYYESTGDAATNFFFSYLPKGAYVFEYPLRVSQSGSFSNGISTIQCMYAPEFSSHSDGIRLNITR